ncbi:MAG: AzlC family ABC transporter permease [Dehalococcoidales bacterium]|nr:AzlC family ABC transporter permease [Dehalococcoidales bacterium]
MKPVLAALSDTLPLAVSVSLVGTVFGVTARRAGMTGGELALMSGLVFAGAAQFAAVSLWTAGGSALQIVITTLIVNLRHLLMGASVARHFGGRVSRPTLAALAAGLSDESYAATTRRFALHGPSARYMLVANSVIYAAWLISTLFGAQFGNVVANPERYALDFAFPAAFLGILVPQIRGRSFIAASVAATAASVLAALVIFGTLFIFGIGGPVFLPAVVLFVLVTIIQISKRESNNPT